ncbi:MAG TPA: AMP-binding protein [Acidimicrobiales bacterium]|nr:AMP-binding protein [Acidimicrobiales bacterium]
MLVPLTVGDFLYRAAVAYPDRIAVIDEPEGPGALGTITYRELEARARGLALALERMGVDQGERVAIVSPNSAKFLITLFGTSAFGRVCVPVNFRLNAEEVSYIVEHSGATVLLIDPEVEPALAGVACKHRIVLDGVADAELFTPAPDGAAPAAWDADESATASVNYTSGTTARPKGVQLTHRNIWLNATTFGWHAGVSDRDTYLHTLPMFHCNGWGMPYALTAMGVPQVVLRKVDGEDILDRIETHGVSLLCGAPAVVAAILDAAARRRDAGTTIPGAGRGVRMVVAGAPPPTKTIERVDTELGWEFIQIYGLTETSPLLVMNRARSEWDALSPTERAQQLGRAGLPTIGVRMDVDENGEVLAKTNHVFAGYWEQPEESAKALDGGWFHTGDGGAIDEEGYVVIADRKKDVIITGGENVSSIEVEDCLFQHPDVAEVAVIGVPDEKWGETIKALVVLRDGASADEAALIAHCRDRMSHFKCPTSVELRSELARTATGKLQKFKLRQPFWEGRDRQVN